MARHVSISEAGSRLPELVAAALGGEEVVLSGDGHERVRLVPVDAARTSDLRDTSDRRRSAIGMWRDAFAGFDTSLAALKGDHADPDERFRRKFGLPD